MRAILKDARIKAGLTQGELCERIKRDRNFVSTVELGTRMLEILEFVEYAEALGLDPRKLLGLVLRPERASVAAERVRRKADHK